MHSSNLALFLMLGLAPFAEPNLFAQRPLDFETARRQLVNEVLIPSGIKNERVLKAVLDTPRHEFCLPQYRQQAYEDRGLPIGDKQTISSPFIVAYMTESLDPRPEDKVLEIGTGSGYQAAILSPLVKEVYSIEIVENLGKKAARTLERLRYKNVFTKVGDGYQGWPEKAPFDKIIVTCSPEKPPEALIEQLKEGGLMVIPAGERYQQTLYLMKKKDGKLEAEPLRPTLFVPMTGRAEETREVQPDPAKPVIVNGGFEETVEEGKKYVPGWYYERYHSLVKSTSAPEGQQFVTFSNSAPGRLAHLLQGFPVDGRKVGSLDLRMDASCKDVMMGEFPEALPMLAVTFYDDTRREISSSHLGPLKGTQAWKRYESLVKVPPSAREAIIRIGLFGATGEASFDNITMRIVPIK
jgi:protein-L-isoaspartate(D-aspartate) O-methyltransferase